MSNLRLIQGIFDSLDGFGGPIPGHLYIDENDIIADVSVGGMGKDDLPDGCEVVFRADDGTPYEGQIGNLFW